MERKEYSPKLLVPERKISLLLPSLYSPTEYPSPVPIVEKKMDIKDYYIQKNTVSIYEYPEDKTILMFPNDSDKYKIEKKLGSGSYGVVYLVKSYGKKYALKVQRPGHSFGISGRTLMEADILRRVQHPNISKTYHIFYDVDSQNVGSLHLVSELADNNLYSWLKNKPLINRGEEVKSRFSIRELVKIAHDILLGIDMLHRHDILHGDLKPENILVFEQEGKFPTFKVSDFGMSERINVGYQRYKENTGTSTYRAPENLFSAFNYSLPFDIFSYGKILLDILFDHINIPYKLDPKMQQFARQLLELTEGDNEYYETMSILQLYSLLGKPSAQWYRQNNVSVPAYYDKLIEKRNNIGENFSEEYRKIYGEDFEAIIDLINICIQYDSYERPSTTTLLQHRIFRKYGYEHDDKLGVYIGNVEPGTPLDDTRKKLYTNLLGRFDIKFSSETLILAYDLIERILSKIDNNIINEHETALFLVALDIAYRLVQDNNILSTIEIYFPMRKPSFLFSLEILALQTLNWILYPDNLLTMCKLNSKVAGNVIKYVKQGSKKEHLHRRMMERAFAGMCNDVNRELF